MKYNYYKVKHEGIRGDKSRSLVKGEELSQILDEIVERSNDHKNMDDFGTEKEFFDWLESKQSNILVQLEMGDKIDIGDYDLIAEREDCLRVYDKTKINDRLFAILVNDETMEALEAVWSEELSDWNTDFSYPAIGINSFDVAGELDFDGCQEAGYTFVE